MLLEENLIENTSQAIAKPLPLFRQKRQFKFEDISDSSGIAQPSFQCMAMVIWIMMVTLRLFILII